ncbi:MAG: flagellin [Alphaproteobacteria bacterium]
MALNMISNHSANVGHRNVSQTNAKLSLALARLSAGQRVLSAKDDAASLAIGSRLAAETSGLRQAGVNAGQGASLLQVADGAYSQISDIMTRMKTLAVQASSGQIGASDRQAINTEFQALASEVDRIAADTDFAGTNLLDGSVTNLSFKVGTGTSPGADDISVAFDAGSTTALGINGADISSVASANAAINSLGAAIDSVQTFRANIGASSNRLGYAASNIATAVENAEAARSGLLDLDMAQGVSDLANRQTAMQTGLYSLTQANQKSSFMLRLMA